MISAAGMEAHLTVGTLIAAVHVTADRQFLSARNIAFQLLHRNLSLTLVTC